MSIKSSGLMNCVLAVAVTGLIASSALATDMTVDSFRKIYRNELKKIKADKSAVPVEEYVAGLQMLEKQKQAVGDLDGVLAVRAERSRLSKSGNSLADEDVVAKPADLAALQTQYVAKFKEGRILPSKRIVSLANQYMARLMSLRVELTKAGKIDDALAANAEIETVKASADYKGAQFAIAEYEASVLSPEDKVIKAPEMEKEVRKDAGAKENGDVKEAQKIQGCTVSWGNTPDIEDVSFSRVSMRATEVAKLKRDVSATVFQGKESDSKRVTRVGSAARRESEEVYIRVALRASGGKDIGKVAVVVQCFAKPASSAGGSELQQIRSFKVPLDELTATTTYIDCPPFSLTSASFTSAWAGNNRWGQSFYGVIVSVFDKEGNVLYQSCSASNLEDFAGKEANVSKSPPKEDDGSDRQEIRPFHRPDRPFRRR